MNDKRREIYNEIEAERLRQDAKWGEQNHPIRPEGRRKDGLLWHDWFGFLARAAKDTCDRAAKKGKITWCHILREEFAEVFAEADGNGQRAELIQMLAVGTAMVECIDRRRNDEKIS